MKTNLTDNSEHIDGYTNVNKDRVSSFPTSDLSRINNDNHETREIEREEIKSFIRRFKNKGRGSSKIDKLVLEKNSEKGINQLKRIFNACYSAEYVPKSFKSAIIKFIPKKTSHQYNL